MENKKQLIIVPPMSEALKKLNEVLEGIAGDENIEISMVDDLKELGQFLAATGQCLVLCSNAKKCATFLQENRFVISRSHSKVMLFTPKEIPAKTLIKFTKVGLTESILENSPPKTLLYKIKLQLRSIKSVAQLQEKEKEVIKNSAEAIEAKTPEEEKSKEKIITEQRTEAEVETKKRFDSSEENVIDYGANLKGKIKPQEEAIDTHWKSKRKNEEVTLDLEAGKTDSDENEENPEDIDMYYRGKSKKTNNFEIEEADYRKLKKAEYSGAEEAEESEKKKSSFLDSYDEEYMKQKRLQQEVSPEDDENGPRESGTELYLSAAKKKTAAEYVNDDVDGPEVKASTTDLILDPAKNKTKESSLEDLGGHYKGAVTNLGMELDQDPSQQSEEKEYDNSELDLEKEKAIDLDLIAGKKKHNAFEYEEEASDNTHDGEIEKLGDDDMTGDGATDHIETMMGGKTTTRTNSRADREEAESHEEKENYERESEDTAEKKSTGLEITAADSEKKKKEQNLSEEDELELKTSSVTEIAMEDAEAKKKKELDHGELTEEENTTDLDLIAAEKTDKDREKYDRQTDEHINFKKLDNTQLDLEAANKEKNRSKVDKIDTFYRSGESKKTEHSWDNLIDDKKDVRLDLIKNKRADQSIAGAQKNDLGEITIDYRKLKQEFDLISRGEEAGTMGAIRSSGSTHLSETDEDASFKVIEPDSKGLELAISMLMPLMDKSIKAKSLFAMIAEDVLGQYNGHAVFYSYKQSDNKYTETYCSFLEMPESKISEEKKTWWLEFKKSNELFAHYQSKSMSTWRSPEVVENNFPWEDVELPKWARQELADKRVELIFPYYDGVDKMGMALVFFPEGIKAEHELSILTSLELARTMLLDTIQRYQVSEKIKLVEDAPDQVEEAPKKNILGFFGGIFGKKKVG